MRGVDVTRNDGVEVTTVLVAVSEDGADRSRFPSDKHSASWLGLCPESATREVFLERHHVARPQGTIRCADRLAAQST